MFLRCRNSASCFRTVPDPRQAEYLPSPQQKKPLLKNKKKQKTTKAPKKQIVSFLHNSHNKKLSSYYLFISEKDNTQTFLLCFATNAMSILKIPHFSSSKQDDRGIFYKTKVLRKEENQDILQRKPKVKHDEENFAA